MRSVIMYLFLMFLVLSSCGQSIDYKPLQKQYGISGTTTRPIECPDDSQFHYFYDYNSLVESMGLLDLCAWN